MMAFIGLLIGVRKELINLNFRTRVNNQARCSSINLSTFSLRGMEGIAPSTVMHKKAALLAN